MNEKPTAFHDLAPEDFPMVIQVLDHETREKLWQATVSGPGALEVPGFAPREVRVRVWQPNGVVTETDPDGTSRVYDLSDELQQIREQE